jgi:prepilin-type processing-associated H-X9-DG protein
MIIRLFLCCSVVVACVTPNAGAQDNKKAPLALSYAEALSGKAFPLSLRASDLTADFRRIRVPMVDAFRGMTAGGHYTKGDSVTIADTTYLIAYRAEFDGNRNFMGHGNAPVPTKLRPNEKLLVSLIESKSIYGGSITDIRPFDRELDIENEADRNNLVMKTLQQLGKGIIQWKHQRGQEKLPVWKDVVTPNLRQTCYPMVHDKRLWEHPSTEEPFRLNPELSGKKLKDVANRNLLFMVYEAKPAADGTRGVLFADGHVERVEAERWTRLMKIKVVMRKGGSNPTQFLQ